MAQARADLEDEAELKAELESMATSPLTGSQALGAYLTARAAATDSESEAEAFAGAATLVSLSAQDRRDLQQLLPVLVLFEEGAVPDVSHAPDGVLIDLERNGVRCVVLATHRSAAEMLSPREMQIARMAAEGCTNRAIANTLEISLWTVSTHLRRVFVKVGVCSRAEMVGQVFGSLGPAAGPSALGRGWAHP